MVLLVTTNKHAINACALTTTECDEVCNIRDALGGVRTKAPREFDAQLIDVATRGGCGTCLLVAIAQLTKHMLPTH